MQLPKWIVFSGALVALAIVIIIGSFIVQPPQDLITHAEFSTETISPNADGVDDLAVFSYGISENAIINIVFVNQNTNEAFHFREDKDRSAGDYNVNFSGVVDGYVRATDELYEGTVERRLMPNGQYTWTLSAEAEDGAQEEMTGEFVITDADSQLPLLQSFEVSSVKFTPNQDGVRDRIQVNVFLNKAADLKVYLEDDKGVRTYLAEREGGRAEGEEGSHEFDYDGGVDDGFEPPEDGVYTLYAVAQDAEGQRVIRQQTIEIEQGGLPQMEIMAQNTGATVCFYRVPWEDRFYSIEGNLGDLIDLPEGSCSDVSTLTLEQGDLLVFKLTVRNYGRTPVRTIGPFPGTVYQDTQQSNSLGFLEKDGVWRVGINCQGTTSDFPWRWAIGVPDENLDTVFDKELNETFYYLDAAAEDEEDRGIQSEVWGAIRMTEILEERNPRNCWAGLIHEGVNIDPFQSTVGTRPIKLVPVEGFSADTQDDGETVWMITPFGG